MILDVPSNKSKVPLNNSYLRWATVVPSDGPGVALKEGFLVTLAGYSVQPEPDASPGSS